MGPAFFVILDSLLEVTGNLQELGSFVVCRL